MPNRFFVPILMAAAWVPGAHGAPAPCNDASLQGEFAFTARGTTFAALGLPPAATGAFASSGAARFDGQGRFTLSATSSFNGAVQGPATVTGTYHVNSDCSYSSSASNGAAFRGVIVGDGSQLLIIQANSGTAIAGSAYARGRAGDEERRVSRCSMAALAGNFGFVAEGAAGAPVLPGTPFGPLVGVGTVSWNSAGKFTLTAQRSVGGVLDPSPVVLTGTASVAGDCSVQLSFDAGFHFQGNLVDGNEILFVETDPGSAVVVKAKRI